MLGTTLLAAALASRSADILLLAAMVLLPDLAGWIVKSLLILASGRPGARSRRR